MRRAGSPTVGLVLLSIELENNIPYGYPGTRLDYQYWAKIDNVIAVLEVRTSVACVAFVTCDTVRYLASSSCPQLTAFADPIAAVQTLYTPVRET